MEKLCFITGEQHREEAERACRNLQAQGVPAQRLPLSESGEAPFAERDGVLFVTDDPACFTALQEDGAAVCGLIDERALSFPGARYLVRETDEIAAEDYEKIYRRIKGLPWTILETESFRIREMTADDVDVLYAFYDEEALKWIPPLEKPETERERMASYIRHIYGFYGFGYWLITDKHTGEPVGRMGYEPYGKGDDAVSFGYVILPSRRGQGVAYETGRAVLEYGGSMLGFTKVRAVTDPANKASQALLAKLGFQKVSETEWRKDVSAV